MSFCRLAMLALVPLIASTALAESAEEMLSSCKKITNDAKISNDRVFMPADFQSGTCWGAFITLQAVIVRTTGEGNTRVFGICSPADSTRTQLILVFVEYARRNPRLLNEEFFSIALQALQEAFPCASR